MTYRWKYHKPRVPQTRPRIPIIELPEHERFDPGLVERKRRYSEPRWKALRRDLLKTRELRRCFFCNDAWSEVLEHLVGHGDDAGEVAAALGLPEVSSDWRDRFWSGWFCGSCGLCARKRSGAEAAGRLLNWTNCWLESNGSCGSEAVLLLNKDGREMVITRRISPPSKQGY